VPHVELSLSEVADSPTARPGGSSLDLWGAAVEVAGEPCLLVDAAGKVVAVSPGCQELFGLDPAQVLRRRLVDGVLRLLDFTAVAAELPAREAEKIPPLVAIASGGLARGLLKVPDEAGTPRTVDAVSAPLRDGPLVVGSITYFALVNR
jgi:PAS domain-containing protein